MSMAALPITTLAKTARARMQPPAPPDPVSAYALDVVAGRVVAGRLVRLACERHLADLATGHERGLRFDAAAAQHAIDFFPVLRHYKGEWGPGPGKPEGDPVRLEPWQQFIVGSLFGWKRADGLRRFRELYLEVARKNGKTMLAAGLAVRLAFFDGEPGAEVYSVASKRDQAKFVWNDAKRMIERSPALRRRLATYALSITDEASASLFRPLGRDSGESDIGTSPFAAVIDELHVIEDTEDIDAIETGIGARREPVIVKITTAGKKRTSVWWSERSDAIAVLEGRATDDSMLVLVYTLDGCAEHPIPMLGCEDCDDPFDEAVWPKANPNLGVSVKPDTLREQADKARRSPGKLTAYLQFRMNVPTQQSIKAIDMELWDANAGLLHDTRGVVSETYEEWVERMVPPGATGYGALDLASVQDLTADLDIFRTACPDHPEGCVAVVSRFYCPEDGVERRSRHDGVPYADWVRDGYLVATPGNVTDYEYVRERRRTAWQRRLGDGRNQERAAIAEIAFDRWNATQLATQLSADGATMIAVPQTTAGLGPGWREMERLLLEGKLHHGGHPILRWMAGNVEVETDAAGNQKPSKRTSSERIDGIVALDMAIGRLIVHVEEEMAEPWVIVR
jgi:phage terminase large subunit-like protein